MLPRWRVGLSALARRDLADIAERGRREWGVDRMRLYRATIVAAVAELAEGPEVLGSRDRGDLVPGLRTLHVARRRRRGRHLLLYRVVGERDIEVLRILHERMDPGLHLDDEDDEG